MIRGCNCFWWDCFACDGGSYEDETRCPHRISPNNNAYHALYVEYDEKMNKRLEKLYDEYRKYFEMYKLGQSQINE